MRLQRRILCSSRLVNINEDQCCSACTCLPCICEPSLAVNGLPFPPSLPRSTASYQDVPHSDDDYPAVSSLTRRMLRFSNSSPRFTNPIVPFFRITVSSMPTASKNTCKEAQCPTTCRTITLLLSIIICMFQSNYIRFSRFTIPRSPFPFDTLQSRRSTLGPLH